MWNETTLAILNAVLNEIIPASMDGKLPAAGDLNIAQFIKHETDKNNMLLPDYQRGLERVAELSAQKGGKFGSLSDKNKVAILKQVEQEDKAFFQQLIRHTYMGYYSRPDVRGKLNLSAKPAHPDGYEIAPETPEYMAELTRPVRKRGPIYRA